MYSIDGFIDTDRLRFSGYQGATQGNFLILFLLPQKDFGSYADRRIRSFFLIRGASESETDRIVSSLSPILVEFPEYRNDREGLRPTGVAALLSYFNSGLKTSFWVHAT